MYSNMLYDTRAMLWYMHACKGIDVHEHGISTLLSVEAPGQTTASTIQPCTVMFMDFKACAIWLLMQH
jgi:hypothetical protein